MIKINSAEQIVLFIQEPEDEMAAIRFIERHKPSRMPTHWKEYTITLKEQAERIGLKGGHGISFFNYLENVNDIPCKSR
jgi:hypothetical protein